MHELSVAQSLVDLVLEKLMRVDEPVRVSSIRVRVGRLSGVVPEALRFAIGPATEGTELSGVKLELEESPVMVYCPACRTAREPRGENDWACSVCGTPADDVVGGKELELVSIEIHDASENPAGS
jgi:hydrogenase nickel incorporation protein HypA/HybF